VVTRLPAGPREPLFFALERVGEPPIRTRCRGSSICGQCWVRVIEADGLAPAAPDEQVLLDRDAPGVANARLACKLVIPEGQQRVVVSTDYW
jgi:ferredoxin